MSSSVITQSDGSALKPQTKSWFKRFKPALWLAPFALFFYLFQLAPMVWVLINSFFYDDEFSLFLIYNRLLIRTLPTMNWQIKT